MQVVKGLKVQHHRKLQRHRSRAENFYVIEVAQKRDTLTMIGSVTNMTKQQTFLPQFRTSFVWRLVDNTYRTKQLDATLNFINMIFLFYNKK